MLDGVAKMSAKHSAYDFDMMNLGICGTSPLTINVATNVHTRQLNPELTEEQWKSYESIKRDPESNFVFVIEFLLIIGIEYKMGFFTILFQ